MAAGEPVLYSLYVYAPNRGAPIFFAVAFAVSAVFHTWQCYRYRAFGLMGMHSLCAVLFAAGYALREYGSYHYTYTEGSSATLIAFVLSQVLIYVCPPLLELANYHVLGRLFRYVPHRAPVPAGRVLPLFGGVMAAVELLNALGVALAANSTSSAAQQATGARLTVAALSLQLLVVCAFAALAGLFHRRCYCHAATTKTLPPGARRRVVTVLAALYASMTLILTRCVYRLVESGVGAGGGGGSAVDITDLDALRRLSPVLRHEAYFYVFEASLMLANSALWNAFSPCRLVPADPRVYLSPESGVEVRAEADGEDRSLLLRAAHVLTFGLLFGRKEG